VRAAQRVAWDRHLADAGALQWDLLEHRTRDLLEPAQSPR
jgi:hypothetical protein